MKIWWSRRLRIAVFYELRMARRKARQEQLRRESAQRAQQAQAKKIADQATAGAYNAYRSKQTTAKHYANMIRPVIHSLDEPPRLDIY